MEWVLILYFAGFNSGGPATINFPTETACHAAHKTIKKEMSRNYSGGICINTTRGTK